MDIGGKIAEITSCIPNKDFWPISLGLKLLFWIKWKINKVFMTIIPHGLFASPLFKTPLPLVKPSLTPRSIYIKLIPSILSPSLHWTTLPPPSAGPSLKITLRSLINHWKFMTTREILKLREIKQTLFGICLGKMRTRFGPLDLKEWCDTIFNGLVSLWMLKEWLDSKKWCHFWWSERWSSLECTIIYLRYDGSI